MTVIECVCDEANSMLTGLLTVTCECHHLVPLVAEVTGPQLGTVVHLTETQVRKVNMEDCGLRTG